ncbi:uncharacterized protein BX664DRAFT_287533 [Halteromyces radiatus]|uniref:uncharacterized protein n=1 Tax=Halteromyces radiatus TaxID=101107 RepID=UPI00222015D4|nr:uncharacterized protein BX664DRAFT_287533 [Halteromyces radiatus]KAI8076752.1 hypothetical protein BX664DRAFT_287533 [Halteromyces radiatus]
MMMMKKDVQGSSCRGDVHVKSKQDLDGLKTCKTYGGNIVVEQTGMTELKLPGVALLEGDLVISSNDALQRVSFPELQAVNGQLRLLNNRALNSLEMPALSALRMFELSVHPALNEVKFPAGLNQVEQFLVADTTVVRIEGLKVSTLKDLTITNNIYLKQLTVGNLTRITGDLTLSANSPVLNADLSSIQAVNVATFRNLASISLKELRQVAGDISFITNTFTALELPSVTGIAGTLTIADNIRLNSLSLPSLSRLGGALSISGNTELISVNAFPKLDEVDGTLDIVGNFDEVDLPALADVRGGLNVQTSSNQFTCDKINSLKKGVIKGNSFACKSSVAKPKSGIRNGKGSFGDESSAVFIKDYSSGVGSFFAMAITIMYTFI